MFSDNYKRDLCFRGCMPIRMDNDEAIWGVPGNAFRNYYVWMDLKESECLYLWLLMNLKRVLKDPETSRKDPEEKNFSVNFQSVCLDPFTRNEQRTSKISQNELCMNISHESFTILWETKQRIFFIIKRCFMAMKIVVLKFF